MTAPKKGVRPPFRAQTAFLGVRNQKRKEGGQTPFLTRKGKTMANISNADEAKRTAEAVLKRDRRRIRALATLTIGLWAIAALLIPSVYLPLGAKMKQYARIVLASNPTAANRILSDTEMERAPMPVPPDQLAATLARVQHEQWILAQLVFHQWIIGAIIMSLALAAGILASISTVALAMTIRRTTLRHVSANLAEISEQLRQLKAGG
jgi:hypothetical protein